MPTGRRTGSTGFETSHGPSYGRRYLNPIITIVIGLTVAVMAYASQGVNGTDLALAFLLQYGVSVPIGVLGFFVCCLLWMGFDAPMHLTALRLAAVYAIVDAAFALYSLLGVPIFFLPFFAQLIVYAWLLSKFLDIELLDAILLAVVTFVLRIAAFVGIAYMLYEMGYA